MITAELTKFLPQDFAKQIQELSNIEFAKKNGNIPKWDNSLQVLTAIQKSCVSVKDEYIFVNAEVDKIAFENLRPWRKGPFAFQNFNLDSEWNGYLKWQRFTSRLDFNNKLVLDVGCGNGYFAMLMALQGAKFVLGLEPFLLFNYQFRAIQNLANNLDNVNVAPLKLEQIPDNNTFDIVLSMGVLYHSKSPIEHILKLKQMLKPSGELLLETLVVDGDDGYSLTPKDRYAKMRNVWFIPSVLTLTSWLKRCGFSDVEVIDEAITTFEEQRKTAWIGENSQSLIDFINGDKTIEGYPRPKRAMFLAKLT